MQSYEIPAELAQAVLNYLARQPYADVYALIAGLQQLEPTGGEPSGDQPARRSAS